PLPRGEGGARRRRRVQGRLAHGRRHAQVSRLGHGHGQARHPALCQHPALRRAERQPQRHHPLRPQGDGRRVLLGRGGALPRQVEEAAGREGHPASGRRREGGRNRGRRHPGVEPRRPPDRGAAGADRLRPRRRACRRRQGHDPVRLGRPQRHRRGARACGRRQRGAGRQGVPVEPWRARCRRSRPRHRPVHRRVAIRARAGGGAFAGRGPQCRGPASGRLRLWAESSLICAGVGGCGRLSPLQGPAGTAFMSAIAETSAAFVDDRLTRRNALVLAVAQALAGGNNTVIAATAGILGDMLAPSKGLATLPVSIMVIGMWCGSLPQGYLARRYGRRFALQTGSVVGTLAGLISCAAVLNASFALFLVGTFGCGLYAAAHQSYRFAVTDTASDAFKPKAISWVLAGGVLAGVIGPWVVIGTEDLWPPNLFAATFVAQSALAVLAGLVLTQLRSPPPIGRDRAQRGRPLAEIARNPMFATAVVCGVVSYVIMNLV